MVGPVLLGVARVGTIALKHPKIAIALGTVGGATIGTIGGITGTKLYDMFFSSGKKSVAQTQEASQPTTATVSPPISYDQRMYDYSATDYFRGSDIADSEITMDTKKSMSQTPSTNVSPDLTQTPSLEQKAEAVVGTDLITLALIGGGALIAYGYVSKEA